MNWCLAWILALGSLPCFCTFGFQTESQQAKSHQANDLKLPFSPYLKISCHTVSWNQGIPSRSYYSFQLLRFLEDQRLLQGKEVLEELEVVAFQKKRLKKLVDSAIVESKNFSEKSRQNNLDHANLKRWLETQEKFQSELENILRPKQLQRLSEVRNRIFLRTVGIQHFFNRLKKTRSIILSAKESSELRKLLRKFSKTHEKKLQHFQEYTVNEVITKLSNKQQDLVRKYMPQNPVMVSKDFDIFLAQLKYAIKNELEYGLSSEEFFENIARATPSIEVSTYDGRFHARKPGPDFIAVPRFIGQLSEASENLIEVTPAQKLAISNAEEHFWNQISVANQTWVKAGKTKQAKKKLLAENRKLETQWANSIHQILNKQQRQSARKLYALEAIPIHGLVGELLNGDFGRELKIDAATKAKIKTLLKTRIQKIEDQLLKREENFIAEIESTLTTKNRLKFQRLLGARLRYIVPSMYTFRDFGEN